MRITNKRTFRIDVARSRNESCVPDCGTAGDSATDALREHVRRYLTRGAVFSITLVALLLAPATAFADCEDSRIQRADLAAERGRAERWNWAWRIANTAGATTQFAVAASGIAARDTTRALWFSGAATSVGALVSWLLPLDISVPAPSDDRCVERAAIETAVASSAAEEREAFWFQHVGSLAVNLGAAAAIAETVSWQAGARSFALGYSIALLQTYTMPRTMWRRSRQPSLTVQALPGHELGVIVGGRF